MFVSLPLLVAPRPDAVCKPATLRRRLVTRDRSYAMTPLRDAIVPVLQQIGGAPFAALCPECSAPIAAASGCVTCVACGWGRCG